MLYVDFSVSKGIGCSLNLNNAHGTRHNGKNVASSTTRKLLQKFKNQVTLITQQSETAGNFNSRRELSKSKQKFLDNVLEKIKKLDDSEWPTALLRLTASLRTLSKRRRVVVLVV